MIRAMQCKKGGALTVDAYAWPYIFMNRVQFIAAFSAHSATLQNCEKKTDYLILGRYPHCAANESCDLNSANKILYH